jgi:hypothetical protein
LGPDGYQFLVWGLDLALAIALVSRWQERQMAKTLLFIKSMHPLATVINRILISQACVLFLLFKKFDHTKFLVYL